MKHEYLAEKNIGTSELIVIGCDGTNVNTGSTGRVITLLEAKYKGHYIGLFAFSITMNYLSNI